MWLCLFSLTSHSSASLIFRNPVHITARNVPRKPCSYTDGVRQCPNTLRSLCGTWHLLTRCHPLTMVNHCTLWVIVKDWSSGLAEFSVAQFKHAQELNEPFHRYFHSNVSAGRFHTTTFSNSLLHEIFAPKAKYLQPLPRTFCTRLSARPGKANWTPPLSLADALYIFFTVFPVCMIGFPRRHVTSKAVTLPEPSFP